RPVVDLARHVARLRGRNKGVGFERLEQGAKAGDVAVSVHTNDLTAEIGSFRELAQRCSRDRKEIAKHKIVGGGEVHKLGASSREPSGEGSPRTPLFGVCYEPHDRM